MNLFIPTTPSLALPNSINLHLSGRTGIDAIRELHADIQGMPQVKDTTLLLHDLLARQSLGANCLSAEIALPHARTTAVDEFVFAIGRSTTGIAFDSAHLEIHLVFLVAMPTASVTEYLRWVALLSRTLRSHNLRQALLNASTVDQVRTLWSLGCERLAS